MELHFSSSHITKSVGECYNFTCTSHKPISQFNNSFEILGQTELVIASSCQNGTLQDLMEYVRNVGVPLEEGRIVQLFLSVCRALKVLHTCQEGPIAHRDIKVVFCEV